MVSHERLTEPRVTIESLLAKPRSVSDLPAFLGLKGTFGAIARAMFKIKMFFNNLKKVEIFIKLFLQLHQTSFRLLSLNVYFLHTIL